MFRIDKINLILLILLIGLYASLLMFQYEIESNYKQNIKLKEDLENSVKKDINKIGFFLVATGKYVRLLDDLLTSMEQYFCIDGKAYIHYFIFTDNRTYVPASFLNQENPFKSFTRIYQQKLGWPNDTLMRFEIVLKHNQTLNYESFDYLYWLDVDMKLVDYFCEDIFGDLVGTAHSHFPTSRKEYPYDKNRKSKAFVDQINRYQNPYYVGAFYGGRPNELLKLFQTCNENIQYDFTNLNYIAFAHDESHLNRYFVDNPPTVILTKSFIYPENDTIVAERFPWMKVYKKKMLAVAKDKTKIRKN